MHEEQEKGEIKREPKLITKNKALKVENTNIE